jgi:hypothetical protein
VSHEFGRVWISLEGRTDRAVCGNNRRLIDLGRSGRLIERLPEELPRLTSPRSITCLERCHPVREGDMKMTRRIGLGKANGCGHFEAVLKEVPVVSLRQESYTTSSWRETVSPKRAIA